jgi:hypothetical protein
VILDEAGKSAINQFWKCCGRASPSFPRNLERAVAFALPVTLVKLPRLHISSVGEWLVARGPKVKAPLGRVDRPIRGCVIAWRGHGVVFVDGADPEDEQRFTLAHEVAHFLFDYFVPRRRALAELGPQIGDVLDAVRAPTADERLVALLRHVPLRPYVNMLERDQDIATSDSNLETVESSADRGAFVLLAPPIEVWRRVGRLAHQFEDRVQQVALPLRETFGLPTFAAQRYSRLLLVATGKGRSWTESHLE